jgi:uncharacterized protein YndB with AHSA1/START domain
MPKVEASVTIDVPIEEVWAYLIDPQATSEWVTSHRSAEILTDGGMREGARLRQVARILGRTIEAETEVVEFEPPSRIGMRPVTGPFRGLSRYDLHPIGNSTHITMRVEAQSLAGVFGKLLDPVITAALRRESRNLRRLKVTLEARDEEGVMTACEPVSP